MEEGGGEGDGGPLLELSMDTFLTVYTYRLLSASIWRHILVLAKGNIRIAHLRIAYLRIGNLLLRVNDRPPQL